tara:strand:- start:107 stop:1357 length:1251 start_codon:yes stop_codon:yes gene_type:complete
MGLLILFSLPIKLDALQQIFESFFSIYIPIRLGFYTLFLPPIALFSIVWNIKKFASIWQKLKTPLIVLLLLFVWMWLGAFTSDYPKVAFKHSGRYSIYLITFFGFLFVLYHEVSKKFYYIFCLVFLSLMSLTFLDWHGIINIPILLENNGMSIDLFQRGNTPTSFFENRNPYAIISVGIFFWAIINQRHSAFLSLLLVISSLYSIYIAGSRNGIFTLLMCTLFLLLFNYKQILKFKTFFIILSCITILGFGYYFSKSQTFLKIKLTIIDILNADTLKEFESIDPRFVIYSSALKFVILNQPVIGTGTKTFGYEVFKESKKLKKFNNEYHRKRLNAHNALLTIWVEMGMVGLIGVIIFLLLWFFPSLRGPPILIMPMLAVCLGQIFDYFVWEIFFMAFQSFFFANFAATIEKYRGES